MDRNRQEKLAQRVRAIMQDLTALANSGLNIAEHREDDGQRQGAAYQRGKSRGFHEAWRLLQDALNTYEKEKE